MSTNKKAPAGFSLADCKEMANLLKKGNTKVWIATKFKTSARTVGRCIDFINGGQSTAKDTVKAAAKKAAKKAVKPKNKGLSDFIKQSSEVDAPTQRGVILGVDKAGVTHPEAQTSKFVITPASVVITHGTVVRVVDKSHEAFAKIVELVLQDKYDEALQLSDKRIAINNYSQGALKVVNDKIYYGELVVSNKIVPKILSMMAEGDERFKHLLKFLERLLNNPSKSSVDQLWGFVAHNDVGITEDGLIIGWKKVKTINGSLFDSRTGKVPNDVGVTVSMPRHMVDDRREKTCSQGLHVGAWDYVSDFSGDTILMVLVDPADIVSVPNDYNDMKMRACKYYVEAVVDSKRNVIDTTIRPQSKGLEVVVGTAGEILNRINH